MAEKKFGWGTIILASSAAALVAGGVVAYLKRDELKKFAEDVLSGRQSDLGDENDDFFEDEPDGDIEFERDIVITDDGDEDDEDKSGNEEIFERHSAHSDDGDGDVGIDTTVERDDNAEDAPA